MNEKSVISLLGCGWLGFPLAINLLSEGYRVKASTTTREKLKALDIAGIDPYLVQFSSSAPAPDLKKLLDAKTLIINIPPGRNNPDGFGNYRQMVRSVCEAIPDSDISRIILISSTSVYSDSNTTMTEKSDIAPDTDSGRLMAETEAVFANLPIKVIILRLAGLIGPQRMPGRFFAGKTEIPNGWAPVNLIHRNDVVRMIQQLIENKNASGIYNGCAPSHPSRSEFYTLAAEIENMEPPHFIPEKKHWKIIEGMRVENELGFEFEFPSLMQFLQNSRS